MATVNTITVEPNAFDVLYDFLPLGVTALARDRSVGDRRLLTQLFQNLLGNAIKFADAARPPVVEIASSRLSNGRQISVSDHGIGIPEQYFAKVFAPFQRLHGADKYPGSGRGLAICKRAVERRRGTIRTEAQALGGSCFKFTLMDEHDQ